MEIRSHIRDNDSKETMEIQSKRLRKTSPCLLYPYISKDNQEYQIESNKQMWINGHISSWEYNQTQVHNKQRHAFLHLFRSYIKRKMTKSFNGGTLFNACVPH